MDVFRTESIEFEQSEDNDFHRLSLQLVNGRFELIVDCVKMASGEFELKQLVDRFVYYCHKLEFLRRIFKVGKTSI